MTAVLVALTLPLASCGSSKSSGSTPESSSAPTTGTTMVPFPALDNVASSVTISTETLAKFVQFDSTYTDQVTHFDQQDTPTFLHNATPFVESASELGTSLSKEAVPSVAKAGALLLNGVRDANDKFARLKADPIGASIEARNDVRFIGALIESLELVLHLVKTQEVAVTGMPAMTIPADWKIQQQSEGSYVFTSGDAPSASLNLRVIQNGESLPASTQQMFVAGKVLRARITNDAYVVRFTVAATDYEATAMVGRTAGHLPRLLGTFAFLGTPKAQTTQ